MPYILVLLLLLGCVVPTWADITSNLTVWWAFDDGSGSTAADTSGNGNDGTIENGATWTSAGACKVHGCLAFNGSNQDVVKFADLIGAGDATMCAWVYPDVAFSGTGSVINNLFFYVQLVFNVSCCDVYVSSDAGSTNVVYAHLLTTATWAHLCVTRKASGAETLYVNGSQVGSADQASGTPSSFGQTHVAAGVGLGSPFKGLIDEVRIFSRLLTTGDITQLYNYGAGPPPGQFPRISWSLPSTNSDGSPLTDLQGTNVYRGTGQTPGLAYAGVLAPAATFEDATPDAAQSCYAVAAVNSGGRESLHSAALCFGVPNAPTNLIVR